jgi:hypothetical protein
VGTVSVVNPTVTLIAIVIAVAGATFILSRLQRSSRRTRTDGERSSESRAVDLDARVSVHDATFRLLSFQGGSVPGDLGPIIEDLRRNGIEVDEDTLRRKLADGVAAFAEADDRQFDLDDIRQRGRAATATLLSASEFGADEVGLTAPWKVLMVELVHELPDGRSINVRRTSLIPTDKLELMIEGAAIPIRVDDQDPEMVVLEWELT